MLPDAGGAAGRPQPAPKQFGRRHRAFHRLPRQYRGTPEQHCDIAQILRLNGYSTAAFGKSHETPPWQVSPSGPTDLWPTRSGFDKFYGFLGGETNLYTPALYEDLSRIEVPPDPQYHLMTDMTDKAI